MSGDEVWKIFVSIGAGMGMTAYFMAHVILRGLKKRGLF